MIRKEKLHGVALEPVAMPASRNNQAVIKDKSRTGQSLRRAAAASCLLRNPRDRNGSEETMSQIQALNDDAHGQGHLIGRIVAFLYGVVTYVFFFVTFLYAIGFVEGMVVPKTIDSGAPGPAMQALIVNLVLMSIFAVQHSLMARPQFKRWWTKLVPPSVERTTYVLLASLALALLIWQWQPLPAVMWQIADARVAMAVTALSLAGWLIVLTSTFLINHFELFGLHQVTNNLSGRPMPVPRFRTPLFYGFVRHPIYLGFIIAFWAAPTMTAGHLLFAAVTTAYIFVGIWLEERDLVDVFGDQYRQYRKRVAMLVPWRKSA
jgi:methanethiol S-methyltransferase